MGVLALANSILCGVNKHYFDNNKGGRVLVQPADLVFEQNLSTSHHVKSASVLNSSCRLSRKAASLLVSSLVPIEPTGIVSWSAVWPRNNANPALKRLLELSVAVVSSTLAIVA